MTLMMQIANFAINVLQITRIYCNGQEDEEVKPNTKVKY